MSLWLSMDVSRLLPISNAASVGTTAHFSAAVTTSAKVGTSVDGFYTLAMDVMSSVEADLHQRILPGPLFLQCLSPFVCDLIGGWPDVKNPTGPCQTLSLVDQILPGSKEKVKVKRREATSEIRLACEQYISLPQ